ncbi:MAG: dTMP kinase [Betaproteobacteria bacterium]|nr:dTMP kinase [Betaproteobacteria bacterium]
MPGKFITFEGLDGAGKSTFIPFARDVLRAAGRDVVLTREPGGTAMGESIRGILLDPAAQLSPESEALLVFAARQQHLQSVVWPALERGQFVLCDRFTDSTFAYQGGGRGMPEAKLAVLEAWVQRDFQPDLTLLFDVDEAVSQARLKKDRALDRFEQEATEFHRRVRQAYSERAGRYVSRIRLVRAGQGLENVKAEVEKFVLGICN